MMSLTKKELVELALRESKDFSKEIRKYLYEVTREGRPLTEEEERLYEQAHTIHIKANDALMIMMEEYQSPSNGKRYSVRHEVYEQMRKIDDAAAIIRRREIPDMLPPSEEEMGAALKMAVSCMNLVMRLITHQDKTMKEVHRHFCTNDSDIEVDESLTEPEL